MATIDDILKKLLSQEHILQQQVENALYAFKNDWKDRFNRSPVSERDIERSLHDLNEAVETWLECRRAQVRAHHAAESEAADDHC